MQIQGAIPELTITTASAADVEGLSALSRQTFTETFAADNDPADMELYLREEMTTEQLAKELADAASIFFLARVAGQLAGYAKMRTSKIPQELAAENPIEIERIYVLKRYHDKKLGAALMHHCLQHGASAGHGAVWLGVWERNQRAISFYERWGFTKFGAHIFKLGTDEQVDVLMRKSLRKA